MKKPDTVGALYARSLGRKPPRHTAFNRRVADWQEDLTGASIGYAYCAEVISAAKRLMDALRDVGARPSLMADWEARIRQIVDEGLADAIGPPRG